MVNSVVPPDSFTFNNLGKKMAKESHKVTQISREISSGEKVTAFNELNYVSQHLNNVSQNEIIKSKNLALTSLKQGLSESEFSIRTMLEINKDATVLWSIGYGNPVNHNVEDVEARVMPMFESIENLLNKKFNNQYLFAGNRSTTKPVEINMSNIDASGDVTDNYYSGDSQIRKEEITDDRIIEYGICANHQAFQEMIGALYYMVEGSVQLKANNTMAARTNFNEGLRLLQESNTKLTGILQDLGGYSKIVEGQISNNEDSLLQISEKISDVVSTDMIEATTRFAALETHLRASYSVISRIYNMTIIDYL